MIWRRINKVLGIGCGIVFFVLASQSLFAQQTTISFKNNKPKSVSLRWVPKRGNRQDPTRIKPGETKSIQSRLGHRFLVECDEGLVLFFEVTEPERQAVELGPTHSIFPLMGWTIHLNDHQWKVNPQLTRVWFNLMVGQLKRVVDAVPPKALEKLQQVPIWVNPVYEGVRPTAEYHPNRAWLESNGRNSEMAKSIEITNMDNFAFENVRMPYLMLHELAHAYHDRVLGFRQPEIRARFETVKKSGSYDQVDRFNGRRIIRDKAYAMSNEKEYFAESTEAFFGKNDFFPFDRDELKQHDQPMHDLLERLWGTR